MKTDTTHLTDLLKQWPAQDLTPGDKENILYWFPHFDFSLLDKIIYADGWSNYDSGGYQLVFLGIDGSLISMYAESSPFGSSTDNLPEDYRYDETTPANALSSIISNEESKKSTEESDWQM